MWLALVCALLETAFSTAAPTTNRSWVHFESAPIHPLDLSPDHQVLAACNLTDARLELFDATTDSLRALGVPHANVHTERFDP